MVVGLPMDGDDGGPRGVAVLLYGQADAVAEPNVPGHRVTVGHGG
jgi:hypothetical protein